MDCSPPGSSVPGILQERILDWVAMPSFRESSQPRDGTCNPHLLRLLHWQVNSLPLVPPVMSYIYAYIHMNIYIKLSKIYTYMHIYSFSYFSIMVYYRILNIVLCAIQLTLFIQSIYSTLHLLIQNSQSIPSPSNYVFGNS